MYSGSAWRMIRTLIVRAGVDVAFTEDEIWSLTFIKGVVKTGGSGVAGCVVIEENAKFAMQRRMKAGFWMMHRSLST